MLGLSVATDEAWVDAALGDLDALLVDHAHCEMKAASNALSLAVRHGDRPELVDALAALAEEELSHFRRVHRLLVRRGLPLGAPPIDPYAAELRKVAGGRVATLVDRLLVAALIEARSCERFRILSERAPDAELRAFYADLLASEAGHYRTFVDLAISEGARDGVDATQIRLKLSSLSSHEGAIVSKLGVLPKDAKARATVHG